VIFGTIFKKIILYTFQSEFSVQEVDMIPIDSLDNTNSKRRTSPSCEKAPHCTIFPYGISFFPEDNPYMVAAYT
jgi:hypothetical protein